MLLWEKLTGTKSEHREIKIDKVLYGAYILVGGYWTFKIYDILQEIYFMGNKESRD